jgi:hypothetical protein
VKLWRLLAKDMLEIEESLSLVTSSTALKRAFMTKNTTD